MFQYSNNYIINTALDNTTGLAKWAAQDAQNGKPARMEIKRMGEFTSESVKSIYRTKYQPGVESQVKFTMKKGTLNNGAGSYMIDLYIRLTNQNLDSRFANAYVLKGAPFNFVIEVTDADTTATMAQKFADQINRMSIEYNDLRLQASVSGSDLIIKAGEQDLKYNYLFEKATLRQYDDSANLPSEWRYVDVGATVDITNGVQPFGDYKWMIQNFILPTTENRQIWNVHEEDQPIMGGHYNQYTITICNRVGVQGGAHVGDVVYAETQHIFYVLDSVATEFETALKKVHTILDNVTKEEI